MTSIGSFTPTYDANGNVLANPDHTYTWDADGKFISVDGATTVTYDALGRVVDYSYPSEVFYLPDGSQIFFKGQLARSAVLKLPGGAAVTYDSQNSGLINYAHADHLGSFRLVTTPTRTFVSSVAFAPFGEQYSGVNVGPYAEFTGQPERFGFDEYDFLYRQFSVEGRWVSPDPAGLAAVDPSDPRSWNRYAYVLNSPLIFIDPLGLCGESTTVSVSFPGGSNKPTNGSGPSCPGGSLFSGKFLPLSPPADGGGGGGGGGSGKLLLTLKGAYCSAVPSGSVTSVGGAIGTLGGATGSLDVVVNYQSGQISAFRSGGGFAGFNGEASAQVSQGLIWGNLGNNNSNYSGPFTNISGSVGPLGVTGSRSSGGMSAPLTFSGPFILSVTGGVSLFGPGTLTGSITTSSQPTPVGNLTSLSGLGGSNLADYVFYLLRSACR
jgi:RHS repeat-associated protein